MDVVGLFAAVVFALSWLAFSRTPEHERVVRLFLGAMMGMAALIGLFGLLLRLTS
ncbi:MAG: hypothetical protein IPM60_12205 [Rhodospirillales bacterium]|nr:hypothetical protein [Rhodospirillales bacterium]